MGKMEVKFWSDEQQRYQAVLLNSMLCSYRGKAVLRCQIQPVGQALTSTDLNSNIQAMVVYGEDYFQKEIEDQVGK